MDKIRILMLNANRRGIGTYHRASSYGRILAGLGHRVTVATVAPRNTWRPRWEHVADNLDIVETPGALYKWWPGWGAGPADVLWRVWHVLTSDYNVIYAFSHHPDVLIPLAAGLLFKRVTHLHDWVDWHAGAANWFRGIKLAHRIDGFFEELPVRSAKVMTANSSLLCERAIRAGADPDRTFLVLEGVHTDELYPVPMPEARAQWDIPQDRPVLGMLAGGNPTRPVDVFVRVHEQVPGAMLLIVGKPNPQTTERIQQYGLAEQVIQTGWVDDADLSAWLSCADVLFFLLDDALVDRARWPHKVNDYMAVGRPVVITRVGDIADFVERHDVGLVAGQDEAEIVEKIVTLLNDPERAAAMGRRGRQVAVEVLDWRNRAREMEHALALALEDKRR